MEFIKNIPVEGPREFAREECNRAETVGAISGFKGLEFFFHSSPNILGSTDSSKVSRSSPLCSEAISQMFN